MLVEIIKILGTIIVATIGAFGAGYFGYKKFLLERQDAKDEKETKLQIDNAITKVKEEMRSEIKDAVQNGIVECGVIGDKAIREVQEEFVKKLEDGLKARGEEGRERFDINSRQIQQNSKQIEEILGIVKEQTQKYDVMADSLTALNRVVEASAESQKSFNYDRILMVANKALKNRVITVTEKTNLDQLYDSWKKLGGTDLKIKTLYNECDKLPTVPDETT